MLSVETAISRVRRDITLAAVLKVAFFVAVFGCLMIGPAYLKMLALGGVCFLWIWLSFTSVKGSRLAAESPFLIASGKYDEAEERIDQALNAFSLFRAAKLQALHQLAVLRHAQHRWQDSARLARALLHQRVASARAISRQSRLILAEALLEMNDLRGTYEAIAGLYQQRLSLAEVLKLMLIQLDYESRLGVWPAMVNDVASKVQLAELMPGDQAARAQSMLALAASKMERNDLSDWLRRRAELLTDVERLCAERPILRELWPNQALATG